MSLNISKFEFHQLGLQSLICFFTDDTLLFCKAKIEQIRFIKEILRRYEACLGQKVNLEKSTIFFSKNTNEEIKVSICCDLEGITEQRCNKYLGLLMTAGRSNKQVFNFIIKWVVKKVNYQKNNLLNSAGNEILISLLLLSFQFIVCHALSSQRVCLVKYQR